MSDTSNKKIYTIKLTKSTAHQDIGDNTNNTNANIPVNNISVNNESNTSTNTSTNNKNGANDKNGYDSDEEIKKYISDYMENGEPAEDSGRPKYKSKKSKSEYTYDIFDSIDPKLFDEKMKEIRTKRPELFTITVEEYREYRKKMYPNYPNI